MEAIRPSSDLRNHYSEISRQCHEERIPVIITVNGRGDTAENDVVNERVAPIQNTFDNIRKSLLERGSDDV